MEVAANVLGTVGTILWSIQLIPQVYKSYHNHSTGGLRWHMFAAWIISGVFYFPYTFVQSINIPIRIQPEAWSFLSLVIIMQILYYDHVRNFQRFFSNIKAWKLSRCIIAFTLITIVFAGVQVGILFGLLDNPADWCRKLVGSLAAFFLFLGILPPYFDIIRYHKVPGLSWLFIALDMAGAVFSMISIGLEHGPIDVLALITYACILVGEAGYVVAELWFRWEIRIAKRKEARKNMFDQTVAQENVLDE